VSRYFGLLEAVKELFPYDQSKADKTKLHQESCLFSSSCFVHRIKLRLDKLWVLTPKEEVDVREDIPFTGKLIGNPLDGLDAPKGGVFRLDESPV
jgi:hypothetical protein